MFHNENCKIRAKTLKADEAVSGYDTARRPEKFTAEFCSLQLKDTFAEGSNMMRRPGIAFLLLLTLLLGLSGCEALDRLRAAILGKASETVSNVNKKVEEVSGQISKTKQSVEQKITDVQNAVKEVGEAVEAVRKVTGDGTTTTSAQ